MTWPTPCTCTPGTVDNGWHEHRSPECLAYEHQQWTDMLERVGELFDSLPRR